MLSKASLKPLDYAKSYKLMSAPMVSPLYCAMFQNVGCSVSDRFGVETTMSLRNIVSRAARQAPKLNVVRNVTSRAAVAAPRYAVSSNQITSFGYA